MWKMKTDIFFTFSLELGAKIKIHAKFFDREKGTKNKKYEEVVLVLQEVLFVRCYRVFFFGGCSASLTDYDRLQSSSSSCC